MATPGSRVLGVGYSRGRAAAVVVPLGKQRTQGRDGPLGYHAVRVSLETAGPFKAGGGSGQSPMPLAAALPDL